MTKAPIRVWTERVDDLMVAVCASCFIVKHRNVYGLSIFVLTERNNARYSYHCREVGERRFRHVLASEHGGVLPWVGRADRVAVESFG